jgi:hypothetical protein
MSTNQISSATNITGPDISQNPVSDSSAKYFNNFYAIKFDISANANDAILAFFEQYTDNKITAKNLSAAVTYTALSQNLNPISVLEEFRKLTKGQLNNYLIAFLNISRVPTSILGAKDSKRTNVYVARTVLL